MSDTALKLSRRQKAAALLLAIGPEASASLFPHMADGEVEALTRMVADLGQLSREDMASMFTEVHDEVTARRQRLVGDRESAEQLVRAWRGARADGTIHRVLGLNDDAPFAFLRLFSDRQVIAALDDEHEQTIALVVANVPAERGAVFLRAFSDGRRLDIARRVATMGSVAAPVIRRIEQELTDVLGTPENTTETRSAGGARELATLLNQLSKAQGEQILEALAERDPELAAAVREAMFVFSDLIKLDNRAVQEVLRGVEPASLATALKGATDDISQLVWGNLSERAATAVREEMELLGKLKRSEVDAAQLEVVRVVRQLAEDGTISIDVGGAEDLVA